MTFTGCTPQTDLDVLISEYNQPTFIALDPISVPHQFTKLQDIEITGFWAAMLSWGQRTTIINKANELVQLMGGQPYDFVMNCTDHDLSPFLSFKHRTFQPDDALYFIDFFRRYYHEHETLETAFAIPYQESDGSIRAALEGFHELFFDSPLAMQRTRKHVSTPAKGSACKRLNMFLRWMVRRDDAGVDFGLWQQIDPAHLMIPLDVHVERVARLLGLLVRPKADWLAVEELTARLRAFDAADPVKYDFALFGLGLKMRRDGLL